MSVVFSSLSPAVTAMAGGVREPVGWFRFQVDTEAWTWSPGLFEIHGFEPGEIVPTSAVFAAHKHPDDRAHTDEVMANVLATGQPFCCRHRIINSRQQVRTVVSIGQGTLDDTGRVTEVHGYFVDISAAERHAADQEIRQAVLESAVGRADIEQAKGALMVVHGISAVDAFEILRWHSQHANVKLRDLATMITAGISSPPTPGDTPNQRIGRLLAAVVEGYGTGWRDGAASAPASGATLPAGKARQRPAQG